MFKKSKLSKIVQEINQSGTDFELQMSIALPISEYFANNTFQTLMISIIKMMIDDGTSAIHP